MSEWKDISTAPKDGTPVVLLLREPMRRPTDSPKHARLVTIGFYGQNGYYVVGHGHPIAIENGTWFSVESEDWGSMGSEMTGWMSDDQHIEVEPTHWMSLPPPPAQQEGK